MKFYIPLVCIFNLFAMLRSDLASVQGSSAGEPVNVSYRPDLEGQVAKSNTPESSAIKVEEPINTSPELVQSSSPSPSASKTNPLTTAWWPININPIKVLAVMTVLSDAFSFAMHSHIAQTCYENYDRDWVQWTAACLFCTVFFTLIPFVKINRTNTKNYVITSLIWVACAADLAQKLIFLSQVGDKMKKFSPSCSNEWQTVTLIGAPLFIFTNLCLFLFSLSR